MIKSIGNRKESKVMTNNTLNISLSDCMCSICLELLVEPVTMPCKHEICLQCFETMLDKTNLMCPMCRMRISTWSRQAANNKQLVDQKRWKQISDLFPNELKNRKEGKSSENAIQYLNRILPNHALYKQGEINKEYKELLKSDQDRRERERKEEELASRRAIEQMLLNEGLTFEKYLERESVCIRPTAPSVLVTQPPPPTLRVQMQGAQTQPIQARQQTPHLSPTQVLDSSKQNDIPLVNNHNTRVNKRTVNVGRSQSTRITRRLAAQASEGFKESSVVTRSKAKKQQQ